MCVCLKMNRNENDGFEGGGGGNVMHLATNSGNNKLPKLTHKQIYDMVNTMTNRKPVRIDENDNIFAKTNYTNGNKSSNRGEGSNNYVMEKIKKQTVQINDVIDATMI